MTYTLATLAESATLPCTKCEGTKLTRPIVIDETRTIPARQCPHCDGVGSFAAVDVPALLKLVKGRKPGTLRSKRPDASRAYYVWRLARFHGGVDVTMPMQATFEVSGDPYIPLLDVVADKVAEAVYGTCRAGSSRWAAAMGYELAPEPGLPATAYPCGPVVTDGSKPYSEQLELV
jgi:hypothetical protein